MSRGGARRSGRWSTVSELPCLLGPFESGGGPPQSKTPRDFERLRRRGSVLECASPLALWPRNVNALERQYTSETTFAEFSKCISYRWQIPVQTNSVVELSSWRTASLRRSECDCRPGQPGSL